MTVVIVGASVAGIATARELRAKGYDGRITLLEAERHLPYDKPPLSKEVLAPDCTGDPVSLLGGDQLAALDLDLRLGVRAASLDRARRAVTTGDADSIGYDMLVIATGVTPRTLPIPVPAGVYTLRSIDDAAAIRAELRAARRLVIVGAGFIGAELATAARAYGVAVTLVELQRVPMAHLFGAPVAERLNGLHTAHGVGLVVGVQVSGFGTTAPGTSASGTTGAGGGGRVSQVLLSDGSSLPADFVVVAIGARPATEWLASSGLDVTDGLRCDERLRVHGAADVYAAGDVARWPHGLYEGDVRIEHWTNASEHAAIVAASVLGGMAPAPQVPYVWSHQYGRLLQIVGQPRRGSLARMSGGVSDGERFVAVYGDPQDRVVGAVCVDNARAMLACRKAINRQARIDELDLPDPARA
jgi:NADPH-dependent 2,4-dienoyl-CoA reductase/sulfur reductase-like enzyme